MFEYPERYKFTEKWFDAVSESWEQIFNGYYDPKKINDVLEIGCYEGRATIFLCEKILKEKVNYDVVDTFKGSLIESGMAGTAERLTESDFIYKNFSDNIKHHPNINFNIHKGTSQQILPSLLEKNKQYDFIYVDASHRSDDTFVDGYFAHKMLRPGGLLIFDDFSWKDPNHTHPVYSPEAGIRFFHIMYNEHYDILGEGYQISLIKK